MPDKRIKSQDLFDNLAHIYRVEFNNLSNTVSSIEVDFDLPRGFVAKIKQIYFKLFGLRSAVDNHILNLDCAVVNDPDDQTSVNIPQNTIQHDVIADFEVDGQIHLDTVNSLAAIFMTDTDKFINFEAMDIDVIAARNIRVNAVDSQNLSVYDMKIEIYYTLEQIKDADLLRLLDIL